MAPPPEYDKEPKAPDKSATNISTEDSKLLHNLINDQHTNSDHKPANTAAAVEVENNKHVETLDDGQLRALLDEAITYKCPKDREGKSSLFKELLEEVEQDEQACEAAARTLSGGRTARRGARGRRALPHSNSLQDLVAALAAEPAPRRAHVRHHAPAPAPSSVSARAIHGGSLPCGVDTSSLLSEEPARAGYLATVRCVNPPPLTERRVSASDANAPSEMELLNRRSKPMFPMTYTARATLEIGSGAVCSGRAVTTTTPSNQVRSPPQARLLRALRVRQASPAGGGEGAGVGPKTTHHDAPKYENNKPRGPNLRNRRPDKEDKRRSSKSDQTDKSSTAKIIRNEHCTDNSQLWADNVDNWYKGLANYTNPLQYANSIKLKVRNIRTKVTDIPSNSKNIESTNMENNFVLPFALAGADKYSPDSGVTEYFNHNIITDLPAKDKRNKFKPNKSQNISYLRHYDKGAHRVVESFEYDKQCDKQCDIKLREKYRQQVGSNLIAPTMSDINPRNVRRMTIGQPLSQIHQTSYFIEEHDKEKCPQKTIQKDAKRICSYKIDSTTNLTLHEVTSELKNIEHINSTKSNQLFDTSTKCYNSSDEGEDITWLTNPFIDLEDSKSQGREVELTDVNASHSRNSNVDYSFTEYVSKQQELLESIANSEESNCMTITREYEKEETCRGISIPEDLNIPASDAQYNTEQECSKMKVLANKQDENTRKSENKHTMTSDSEHITKPDDEHTTNPEVGLTANPGIEQSTYPEIEQITNSEVEHTTNPEIEHTTNSEVEHTTNLELEHTTNPEVEHTTNPEIEHTTNSEVEHTTNLELEHTTNSEVEHTTNPEVEHTTNLELEHTTNSEVEHTTNLELEHTTNPEVEHTTNPEIEHTTNSEVEHTTNLELEHTTNSEVEHTTNPEVEHTTNLELEHTTNSEVEHTTNLELEHTTNPEVEHTTNPEIEHTTNSEVEHTTNLELEHTTNPEVEHTTNPEIEHTTNSEVEHTTKLELEHTTNPEVEHTTNSEIEHTTNSEVEHTTNLELEQTTNSEVEHTTNPEVEHTTNPEIEHTTNSEVEHTTNSELEHTTSPELEHTTNPEVEHSTKSDRIILTQLPNNAYIFLTLPKPLVSLSDSNVNTSVQLLEIENNNDTKPLVSENNRPNIVKKKRHKMPPEHPGSSDTRKSALDKNVLKLLLFENLFKNNSGENLPPNSGVSAITNDEVDSAISFSCITTPEVVSSCNTTSSTAQSAVAVDPKPRSVISSSFNGLPLSRPNYGSTGTSASDDYKKSLDENGNSVQGFSSPLSGSSQHKKPRRKKSSKNETVIDCQQIDGYQGDKDVNELLRFIESNADNGRGAKLGRVKHKDDSDDKSGKKRSTERRKDKENKIKRASSLEELSRTKIEDLTDVAEAPLRGDKKERRDQPAKVERRSWGDDALYSDVPDTAAAAELTDFQTVTKKRKPRRRPDDVPPRRARAPSPRRQESAPPSERSNDSNDDMDSVHSLPAAPQPALPPPPPPMASYADIARTRHNIPDLIESCNFYAEGPPAPPGAAPDADGYPALAARRRDKAARARKPAAPASPGSPPSPPSPAPDPPAPDVVQDRRPPVILLDEAQRPRDMDGVTFGFELNEQLLGGGPRRPRCDLLRDAPDQLAVRAGAAALRYVPPDPPADTQHLLQIVDYVGAAWEDVVRCGGGKVRYFSE